ncbi:hypothetical protein FRB90_004939 [Tulasnella sp. 427]|nr:hypothetical protein FRB90_004939 [Tulasnella sp. 427]
MASQASQIAKDVATLKRGLQEGKQEAQDLPARWKALETLITQTKSSQDLWKTALTKEVLKDIVDAAVLTFQMDKSGEASASIISTFDVIWNATGLATTDAGRINAFGNDTIRMAEAWWAAYKDSIPTWRKEDLGVCGARLTPLCSILVSVGKKTDVVISIGGPSKLCSAPIQELVLTQIALGSDPPNESQYDNSFIDFAALLDASLEIPKVDGIPAIVGDPSSLARRLNRNVKPDRPMARDLGLLYGLLYDLLPLPKVATILKEDENLAITVASGLWRYYEECGFFPIPERNKAFAKDASVVAQLFPGKPDQMKNRFKAIMIEHDFISVIIKVLYAFGQSGSPLEKRELDTGEKVWNHWEDLKKYLIANPALFKAPLHDILQVKLLGALDIIRCNKGKFAARATKWLEDLATFADVKESNLRKAAIEERRKAQGGKDGCGWYRCVLYRQATDQVMHW